MKLTSYEHMNCSLAQALTVLGERWALLIIRDAFFGLRRFEEFQKSLGIARNMLTMRLRHLEAEGVLERHVDAAGRPEYRLTKTGLDLQPVLLAMHDWGEKHRPNPKGRRLIHYDRKSGKQLARMTPRTNDGAKVSPKDVVTKRGPALQ